MKIKLSLISALLLGVFASGAQAGFQSCVNGPNDPGTDYDIRTKVSTATDCIILQPLDGKENDEVKGGNANYANFTVNLEGFFGFKDWLFDGKWDKLTATNGIDTSELFDFEGNPQAGFYQAGSYRLAPDVDASGFSNLMFVLKDGEDTNLVGYLLDMKKLTGNYQSPFVEPPFSLLPATGPKDISHISVYFRVSSTSSTSGGGEVPEPGILGLLGLGLLGLALARRRG